MKKKSLLIAILLMVFLISPNLFAYEDTDQKDLLDNNRLSLGVIGAMHLKTTYINPLGEKYVAEASADQQKYYGLACRWFFQKNIGIGANFLLLDAVNNMYEFGTLLLWDFNALLRVEFTDGIVLNAAAGLSRLMLAVRNKSTQENSIQWGDISYNVKIGLEVFLFESSFSITLDWKMQQYTDHNNYKTEMQSLVAGLHFWF